MDKSDWLVAAMMPKERLRSALVRCGVPYQPQHGQMPTLKSLASSWAIQVIPRANCKEKTGKTIEILPTVPDL